MPGILGGLGRVEQAERPVGADDAEGTVVVVDIAGRGLQDARRDQLALGDDLVGEPHGRDPGH